MHGSGPYSMPYNRHGPRQPMAALARGLGAACRISVARLRPAESDVRGMSSTLSKTVGAVRQVRGGAEACSTPTIYGWLAGWLAGWLVGCTCAQNFVYFLLSLPPPHYEMRTYLKTQNDVLSAPGLAGCEPTTSTASMTAESTARPRPFQILPDLMPTDRRTANLR
eukprot:COSAG05_NODE_157_length_15666_cov_29.830410_11_plen_166_part_00